MLSQTSAGLAKPASPASTPYCLFSGAQQDEMRFACSDCGKIYKHLRSLRTHLKFECGKAPAFSCPYCPFQTKRKQQVSLHVKLKHRAQLGP
ncbi:Longitudinals lacking protein, isoforms A/B/D/L [Frankliniella fusca]|uniref:Longitudinals lacking protein, isoforms A/B/D/L n=1 Tax=Frankliniella fusca TaxID=407009 RepID=A0AAE1H647_9NEOP|nr:Longitudinals lacking protein, isoforms A/B/D/L [Frankliniella fusca]